MPSVPTKRLAAAILSTDATFTLNNYLSWKGVQDGTTVLVAADFPSTTAYGCFRNTANTQIEFFTWDPSTVAGPITILARGLDYRGGTTDGAATAAKYTWPANSTLVELGAAFPANLEKYMDRVSDETVAGIKTFSSSPVVPTGGTGTQAANATDIANAVTGASGTATNLVNGTTKLSVAAASAPSPIAVGDNDPRVPTQGENDGLAATTTPATTNLFITQKDLQKHVETYATSGGSANAYTLTTSPAVAAYAAGMEFEFKANFTNTGQATLNVSGLGAKTLMKWDGATQLVPGDIISSQVVKVKYDGTNMQIISPVANIGPSADPISGAGYYATTVIRVSSSIGFTATGSETQNANATRISTTTNSGFDGILNGTAASATANIQYADGIDVKLSYVFTPSVLSAGATPAGAGKKWYVHGLANGANAQSIGDITAVGTRVCFTHYNGRVYATTGTNAAITTTDTGADPGVVKKHYAIDFTPTSCKFYINGALVATHTTNIPTSADDIHLVFAGYDGSAGTVALRVSPVTLAETLS